MSAELEQLTQFFKSFMRDALIDQEEEKVLAVMDDDVIGIGMGEQGIVSSKRDVTRILGGGKADAEKNQAEIEFVNIQARCYEGKYGAICGVVKIKSAAYGKSVESTIGQILNVRKKDGAWSIFALQATPIFSQIEEMEAYPIKFAENVLEKYRQQEQIAKNAQDESIAIYRINYTDGIFEEAILKNDIVIRTEKGDPYEKVIIEGARRHLNEEERYQFIQMFSLGNVLKAYHSGQTELSMDYEMLVSAGQSVWMKTTVKLYTDKVDEKLRGYLYVADVSEEKRREQELTSRAEQDPMTELYNKKYTELKITEKLKTLSPANQGAFLMIDLDDFKSINDTYGHHEGDRIIWETAKCIRALIRKNDIAGRLGGDEFCAYLQGELTREGILEKAELLCSKIRKLMPTDKNGVSCSIGIALCSSPALSFEKLYQSADKALYQQKRNGRDGYAVYSEIL